MQAPADLVCWNGKLIPVDARYEGTTALAVTGSRIQAIGGDAEILALAGDSTRRIDLEGRTTIPGLIDGHAHMDREGLKGVFPSLAGVRSIDDILARIAEEVARAAPGEWIVTMPIGDPPYYWDVPGILKEGRFPNRWELDRVAPDNPVYIRPIWGFWRHTAPLVSVANTRALELAGITSKTLPPTPSVHIDRHFETGEPTGIFLEWTMIPIVELSLMKVIPRFTHAHRVAGMKLAQQAYHAYGTTAIFEEHGAAAELIDAYRAAHAAGALTMRSRLVFSPSWEASDGAAVGELLASWMKWLSGRGLGDDMLRLEGIFAEADDPQSDNRIRAGVRPYTGWSGFYYDSNLPEPALRELLLEAARNNIRPVGLWPNLLDMFEAVNRQIDVSDRRWVYGHINVLNERQIDQICDLGLALTTHTNRYIYKEGPLLKAKLPPERENDIVPLRTLLDRGVKFGLATDNVPVSLFWPIWQTVTRRSRSGDTIAPEQAISREEALRCATEFGAWLTFDEDERGTLTPGKLADFAVLSQDPLKVDEDDIAEICAEMTVVGGRIVFERDQQKPQMAPSVSSTV